MVGSLTALLPQLLPAEHLVMWLTSVTCGLLFLSSTLWGRTMCAGQYFALGAFFFYLLLMYTVGWF